MEWDEDCGTSDGSNARPGMAVVVLAIIGIVSEATATEESSTFAAFSSWFGIAGEGCTSDAVRG
jgi:hypothetical protein